MNTLLDIVNNGQSEIQGVAMLMVLAAFIVFILSWAVNRISILRIRKDTERIRDLSIVLQHSLNISRNYVVRLNMQNRVGYNLHGSFMPPEGISYADSLNYVHPEDRETYINFHKQIIGGSYMAECIFRWDSSMDKHLGQWTYIHDKGVAEYRDASKKKLVNIYCTLTDITEQKEEELSQLRLTNKYRMLFEQSIAGVAFFDKDGRLITANGKMREIMKFQSEHDPFFYDATIYDLPTFREVLNNRHIEELFFCTKSVIIERGVNSYTEQRVHPIYDEEGELIYITLSVRDITQERELYLKNKENEETIRRTNEAIQQYETELQYLMDMCDMRFFRVNYADQTCTFYKSMSTPEAKMNFDELLSHFTDGKYKEGIKNFESYTNGPRTNLIRMRPIFHAGEELQWNFIDSVPSYDDEGKLTGSYGIIRNVTPLIEKQEQLKQETERANDSGRRKSVFMANMTHEIRTPLNAIVGFSDVLPMLQTDEEKKEIIGVIMNNCDMLLRLINDILAVSDLESGGITLVPVETDFAVDFNDICKSLAQRVQTPGVAFIVDNPYTTLKTCLDKERIQEVLTNFVTNAVKYTQQGHIKVGYEYRDTDGGGLYLYCEDTGSGIPKADQSKIFERFVKLNDFVQGTGLGLNISKAIAEKFGGKIGVISEGEGKGSTFWVWIPCERK